MTGRHSYSAVQCMLALRRLSWTHRVMHTPHSVLAALTTHCTWTDDRDGRVDSMDGRTGRRPDGRPVLWCMRTSVHVLHVSIDAYLIGVFMIGSDLPSNLCFAKQRTAFRTAGCASYAHNDTIPISHGQRSARFANRSRTTGVADRVVNSSRSWPRGLDGN